jgi:hypothetical protein
VDATLERNHTGKVDIIVQESIGVNGIERNGIIGNYDKWALVSSATVKALLW